MCALDEKGRYYPPPLQFVSRLIFSGELGRFVFGHEERMPSILILERRGVRKNYSEFPAAQKNTKFPPSSRKHKIMQTMEI